MYPKIETYFKRGADFKVDVAHPRVVEFEAVDNWNVEEKCDGMNIQIHMAAPGCEFQVGEGVVIQGRTLNAQFRPAWIDYLKSIFTAERAEALFKSEIRPGDRATIFGELMGPKINGNPHGLPELQFRLFDVFANGCRWLSSSEVDQVTYHFLTKGAPHIGYLCTTRIVHMLREGEFHSAISTNGYFEGVVCRPACELQLQNGTRLIWKLKTKDFA